METQSPFPNNSSFLMHHTVFNDSSQDYDYVTSSDSDQVEGKQIISDEFMEYSTKIVYIGMCGTIVSFGIAFNVINIIVFIKQGFADSVNISLFALAVADLGTLCSILIQSLCYNIWINQLMTHINFRHVQYIAGAWPRGLFTRISAFITAYISFERCLCIMLPLKVKAILTRRVTLAVIAFIYVTILSGMVIVYTSIKLHPVYFHDLNKTVTSLVHIRGQKSADMENDYLLTLSLYQVTAFVLVWVFTLTLVGKMKSKNQWRESSMTSSQAESMSARDSKVVKMVLLISVTFIVCNTPSTVQMAAMYSIPVYNVKTVYRNLFVFVWSVCVLLEAICASLNIFFYHRMSSKYAAILDTMLPKALKCARKKPGEEKEKASS